MAFPWYNLKPSLSRSDIVCTTPQYDTPDRFAHKVCRSAHEERTSRGELATNKFLHLPDRAPEVICVCEKQDDLNSEHTLIPTHKRKPTGQHLSTTYKTGVHTYANMRMNICTRSVNIRKEVKNVKT